MKVTRQQFWTYLSNPEGGDEQFLDGGEGATQGVTEAIFRDLKRLLEDEVRKPIRPIFADQHMSENHPGGDTIVGVVDEVLAAIQDGYRIITWYGSEAEALVAGYLPDCVTVED